MDEQGQQEDLEEKLKEYVDGLTDKRYPLSPGSLHSLWPPSVTQGGLASPDPSLDPQCQDPASSAGEPAPGPGIPPAPRLASGMLFHPSRCPGKVPQERSGRGAWGPRLGRHWPSLTGRPPAGKGEEQALAAAVLGLLCVQLGPGSKGEELFRSLRPLLQAVLSECTASPAARLHVSVWCPKNIPPPDSPAPRGAWLPSAHPLPALSSPQ